MFKNVIFDKKNKDMSAFNTIHIFGYGETQLISSEKNGKTSTSNLTKVSALIDEIDSKKPSDVVCSKNYHSVTLFKGMFVQFIPKVKEEKSYRVNISEISDVILEEFVTELTETITTELEPAN